MKKIILTGGGTAGHVMPHLALIPELIEDGYVIDYIGSKVGIERTLIEQEGLPYHGIASGKLRRYRSFKNFTDIFRVLLGIFQSIFLIRKLNPSIVFSKGGFVTVPVVIGAWLNHVPIIIHESDLSLGLANKIAFKFATILCTSFPETLDHLPKNKGLYTGPPIRKALLHGHKEDGLAFTHLTSDKPIVLVTGGSLGAKVLNQVVREALPELLHQYQFIHLCGKGNVDTNLYSIEGYRQYEFIGNEMADIYAAADLVISRAGSNTITELLALKKLNLLIPLPARQSRGDQLQNAENFQKAGFSYVIQQADLTSKLLSHTLTKLFNEQETYYKAMAMSNRQNGVSSILSVLKQHLK